jgi:hypothetical protein
MRCDAAPQCRARPRVGRLGVRARTPPKPRAFPRLAPRPEMPHFYPAPRVAPRRPSRTPACRAPGGPPIRPAPRRTCARRGSAVPRWNLRHHPVVTAGQALYIRPPIFPLAPATTTPARSTEPSWPPPPNSPFHAFPVPSELLRGFPFVPWT